ncbi:MAG: hypothetical protein CVU71_05275 [Deltaproteobacteria bacterium HGW-Deltaproteobacteria-6]|jgi:uncharacterized membrane protein YjfL (UPF0719 family)|nr:MAG: hypothetical protein CVU71_05275 [Deltaproteobacteria bacterium HGW-Deltaproteobacteria-6]
MEKYLVKIIYIVLVIVFLFLSKKIADAITRFDDDAQISQNENLAIALRRFGIFVGICIALQALNIGASTYRDIGLFAIYALIVVLIFFAAHFINDFIIIPSACNNELVKAGNVPTGLIEAGAFIATGILVNGAFSGEEGGILSAAAFFFLGQVVMIAAIYIHEKIYRFHVTRCVQDNNLSAGVAVAGLLVAYSIILRASIAGDFTGWVPSLTAFAVSAVTGMIALIIFERIAALIFLPKTSIGDAIRDGNTAAVVLVQAITIGLSLMISQLI